MDSNQRINTSNGFILKYYSQHPDVIGTAYEAFHFLRDSFSVNPELYKDFNDFLFDDIIAEAKSLPIKTIMESDDIKLTRELISLRLIENMNSALFEADAKLPKKEY